MYKKISCAVAFAVLLMQCSAQLSLSLHEPPSGIVQRSQLWNMTLIYTGNNAASVTIGLSLFEGSDNQPVMTAFTRPLTLYKGVRQLKSADVEPIDYNYLSPGFDVARLPESFLPVGQYRACYTIYEGTIGSEPVTLAEDCMNVEVDPLGPPQLNFPADSASLETPYPQFSWLPPTPVILFTNLNYDLIVTEVQSGQSANEAIQENLPVYSASHLSTVVNNYPSSNKSLDTGKVYAWRIIAKNGEAFTAQSDVWTFSVATKKPAPIEIPSITYLELRNDNSFINTAQINMSTIGINFYSYEQTHEAVVTFFDSGGRPVKQVKTVINYGNNLLSYSLDNAFKHDEVYTIQVPCAKGRPYSGTFMISKPSK